MAGPWQTHVDADGWEPIDLGEVIVGEVHLLRSDEGERPYAAGLWRVTGDLPAPFPYDFAQDETIHILEGAVQIAVVDGPVLELSAGEIASFAAGSSAVWRVVRTPFRELFVLS